MESLSILDYPVRQGIIYQNKCSSFFCCDPSGITISTFQDSVFHFQEGIVAGTFEVGDCFALVIKNSKGDFFTYSNLRFLNVKKGDIVNKGDYVGQIVINESGEANELDMLIYKNTGLLSAPKTIKYILSKISSKTQSSYIL
jgi:hypothetical protein